MEKLDSIKPGSTIDDVLDAVTPYYRDYVIERKQKGDKNFSVASENGRRIYFFEFDEEFILIKKTMGAID